MSNFSPKLKEMSEDQLWHGVNEHSAQFAQIESNELVRRSIMRLDQSITLLNKNIEENNRKTGKYNNAMMNLTLVLFFVAVLQILVPVWLTGLSQWSKFGITILVMLIIAYSFWYAFNSKETK